MFPLISAFIGVAFAETALVSGFGTGKSLLSTLARLSFVMSRVIFLCWSRMVSVQ